MKEQYTALKEEANWFCSNDICLHCSVPEKSGVEIEIEMNDFLGVGFE